MLPADAAAELSRRMTALESGELGIKPETNTHLWWVAIAASTIATVLVALVQWGWQAFRARQAQAKGTP